jgi:hypothetical protein
MRAGRTLFDWWVGNIACLRAWLGLAGFGEVRRRGVFRIRAERSMRQWHVALEATAPGLAA